MSDLPALPEPAPPPRVYLGDGVYAELAGGAIRLTTTPEGSEPTHVLYVSKDVFSALVNFARDVWF